MFFNLAYQLVTLVRPLGTWLLADLGGTRPLWGDFRALDGALGSQFIPLGLISEILGL